MAPPTSDPVAPDARDDDVVAALRRGDVASFVALVGRHHAALRRVARRYVSSDAVADEVVQETWLAVVKGLPGFEGRSSLKTWIFTILANIARTRGAREHRTVPFSGLALRDEEEPAVATDRFQGPGDVWPSHWATPPRPWQDPERRLAALEVREHLLRAIEALPPVHQAVITCRDVEGLDAEDVCRLLDLTDGNQRVILHRARARVRAALEEYLDA